MQSLTSAMQAHLQREVTSLATCWKITRRDGEVLRFTDHLEDVRVDGEHYLARSGMLPSAVTAQAGLAVDNLEIEGMLRDDTITQDALLAGAFDHAELRVFMVDYAAPDAGILHLKTGWLGEVTLRGGQYVVEVRGISAALNQTVGEVYTAHCRAELGDARCGKSLAAFTVSGSIDSAEGSFAFTDAARSEANGYFSGGTVTFTSGANTGVRMEVRDFRQGRFGLFLPTPQPLQPGDSYTVIAGCDKRFDTCVGRFSNAMNFRGEPHVPGNDKLFETATTRS